MSWWHPDRFEKKIPVLRRRMEIIGALRGYFGGDGFLEVETPALQTCPAIDAHIHAFGTDFLDHAMQVRRRFYLHTSPELAMKKLLVAGLPKIFQICHVFRNAESGARHSPEFTMLEWYRAGESWEKLIEDCVSILRAAAGAAQNEMFQSGPLTCDVSRDPFVLSVSEAFDTYAGIDLAACLEDRDALAAAVNGAGIRTDEGDSWSDLFFRVMAEKIEPHLGTGAPCILHDYPACLASLARPKPDDARYVERAELYVCGVELANGFGELTDAAEQKRRYIEEMNLKEALYGVRYPEDAEFIRALEYGMPESCGMALGVDRLAMLATGTEDIEQVLWTGKP